MEWLIGLIIYLIIGATISIVAIATSKGLADEYEEKIDGLYDDFPSGEKKFWKGFWNIMLIVGISVMWLPWLIKGHIKVVNDRRKTKI